MKINAQKITTIQRISSLIGNNGPDKNISSDIKNISSDINIGIDVDGTLTKEKIDKEMMSKSPDKIAKAMSNCLPKEGIDILFENDYNIYIITGRLERYRDVTKNWLDTYGISYKDLTMFPNNFYAIHGYSVPKYVGLKLDLHIQKNIRLSFDDNIEVIKILNQFGIQAHKVDNNFRTVFEKVLRLKEQCIDGKR